MEGSEIILYVVGAILSLGALALGLQASLYIRYVFGRWRLQFWNKNAPQDWPAFLDALAELQHRFNWVYKFLHSSGQALGITSGQFRVEYTTEWFREKEDALFRHAFTRFATASLLIFGLGGTFWYFIDLVSDSGLITALQQMTTVTGDQNKAYLDLSNAFLDALGGFGQAFKASLAGLAATIVLTFTNQIFVERSRAKFVNAWSCIAHDWEERMLEAKHGSEAVAEAYKPSPYAPLSGEVTGPEVAHTLSVVNTALNDAAKTQDRWQQLVDALNESRDFHLQALNSIAKAGEDQRNATQTLVDEMIMQVKTVIIPGLADEVRTISEAKIEHFKEAEEKLAEHFKALEQTWAGKLNETLATFAEQSREVTSAARQEVAATRSEALTAGERVAESIRTETQQALKAFQELLDLTTKSQSELSTISAAKIEHFKQAEESIAQHFKSLEQTWAGKLDQTLATFAAQSGQLTSAAQQELAATRSEALNAGERVAEAIRAETQQALKSFRELLELASKSHAEMAANAQNSAASAQQELAATRSEALNAGERVAEAIRAETQQALSAFQDLLNLAAKSQAELSSSTIDVHKLHGEVRSLMKDDKEALSSYMLELQRSLDAWKKAPKAIEGALTELAETTSDLTHAMEQAAKMPSRWTQEIDDISRLLKEGYDRRLETSLWHQVSTKSGTAWERVAAYMRNLKK